MVAVVVSLETRLRFVVFTAHLAVVFLLRFPENNFVVHRSAVLGQKAREHEVIPADFALERFLAGVEINMLPGVRADAERFAADFAPVFR